MVKVERAIRYCGYPLCSVVIESAESVPLAVVLVAMDSTARGLHIGRGPGGGARIRRAINTHIQHACSAHAQAPLPRDVLFLGLCVIVFPVCPAVAPFPASIIYSYDISESFSPQVVRRAVYHPACLIYSLSPFHFLRPQAPSYHHSFSRTGAVASVVFSKRSVLSLCHGCLASATRRRKKHLSPVSTRPPAHPSNCDRNVLKRLNLAFENIND